MSSDRARVLSRPIPLLVLAAAVLVGTFSGVGWAATRSSARAAAPTTTVPQSWTSTTASASKTSSISTPKPVFHTLKLLNGWKSAAALGTGTPQYAVVGAVVYLAGSLEGGKSSDSVPVFMLPAGARPGFYDCFTIYSSNYPTQYLGVLHIKPTGYAYLSGAAVGHFSSIVGVSFVVGH